MFNQATSKTISRHEIRKGIAVISEMEIKRHKQALETRKDRRYYRLRLKDTHLVNHVLTKRLGELHRRNWLIKPTKANLESRIRAHAFYAYAPNDDWSYPCGHQDYLGELRDNSRRELKRLCQALKALNYLNR